jgi:hypothetical protein
MAKWTIEQTETWLLAVCEKNEYYTKCAHIVTDHIRQQLQQAHAASNSTNSSSSSSSNGLPAGPSNRPARKYPTIVAGAGFGTTTMKGRDKQLAAKLDPGADPSSAGISRAGTNPSSNVISNGGGQHAHKIGETAGQFLGRLRWNTMIPLFPPNPAADSKDGDESSLPHNYLFDQVRKRSAYEIRKIDAQEVAEKESRRLAIEKLVTSAPTSTTNGVTSTAMAPSAVDRKRKIEPVPQKLSGSSMDVESGPKAAGGGGSGRGGIEDELEQLLGAPTVIVNVVSTAEQAGNAGVAEAKVPHAATTNGNGKQATTPPKKVVKRAEATDGTTNGLTTGGAVSEGQAGATAGNAAAGVAAAAAGSAAAGAGGKVKKPRVKINIE